jgi:hypothetical protein
MKKFKAILCAFLFVCGALVVPLLHQAGLCFTDGDCTAAPELHGDHDHEGNTSDSGEEDHDPDSCAICKLAATPTITSCGAIQVEALITTAQPLQLATITTVSRLDSGTCQARAPPCLPSI